MSASTAGSVLFWNRLTAMEIRALAAEAVTILPLGATEQHGPHLATGTDTMLNEGLQSWMAEAPPPRGKYLFLPTLPLGASDHHLPFGGTMSLPATLYAQTLTAIIRSLMEQGHRRIFLLNSHGGNQAPMQVALAEVALQATRKQVLIGGASYWSFCGPAWKAKVPDLQLKQIAHACEIETSMLMAIRPDLTPKQLPAGQPLPGFVHEGWSFAGDFGAYTVEGHIGFPAAASVVKGERLWEIAAQTLADFLLSYAEAPLPRSQIAPS